MQQLELLCSGHECVQDAATPSAADANSAMMSTALKPSMCRKSQSKPLSLMVRPATFSSAAPAPPLLHSLASELLRKVTRSVELQLVVGPSKIGLQAAERPNGKAGSVARHRKWVPRPCSPCVTSAARRPPFVWAALGVPVGFAPPRTITREKL